MSDPSQDEERREALRVVNKSSVLHQEYSWPPSGDQYVTDQLIDLSTTGFSFESDASYAEGDLLQVRLQIYGWTKFRQSFYLGDPESRTEPLVALAKVVSSATGDSNAIRYGCEFESIDDGDAKALAAYLEKLQSKAP